MARVLGVLGLALALWLAGAGRAEACRPSWPPPGALSRPLLEGAELRSESIAIRCDTDDSQARCTVRAEYGLTPSAARSGAAKLVLGSSGLVDLHVTGGRLLPEMAEDRAAWLAVYGVDEGEQRTAPWRNGALEVQVIALDLPAGLENTVVIEGTMVVDLGGDGCSMSGSQTRHIVVSPGSRTVRLAYHAAGTGALGTAISIDLPSPWRHDGAAAVNSSRSIRLRRRHLATVLPELGGREFQFSSHTTFTRGGPLVGVGIDLGDGPRLRLRAGYELAAPRFMIYGLVAESDLRSLTVVPTVEVASPGVWVIFPSLGIGAGAPVRVVPDPRAGVRVLGTLSWPIISLVGTFDAFPAQHGATRDFLGGIMLQASI